MAIRPHQMRAALVHLPITLLPLAVGADLPGCIIRVKSLHSFGQMAIVLAAAGAGAAAVTGLIVGKEVNVEDGTRDMLMAHRNPNFTATVVAIWMAAVRSQRKTPSALYLGVGAAGVGLLVYTAYLGGKFVYKSGAGIEPAHGFYRSDAPTRADGDAGAFFKAAITGLVYGLQHIAENASAGYMVQELTAMARKDGASSAPIKPARPMSRSVKYSVEPAKPLERRSQ